MEALATVKVGDTEFQIGRISALKQFHISRRLTPLLAAVIPTLGPLLMKAMSEDAEQISAPEKQALINKIINSLPAIGEVLAQMPDADAEFILFACLDVCMVKQDTGWAAVRKGGVLMFQTLDMPTMLSLTWEALKANLGSFFLTELPKGTGQAQPPTA